MHDVTQKLAKNTAIQVAGKVVGTIMSLATFAILVNHLAVDGFGALTVALNFGAMFGILVDFGITLTATAMIQNPTQTRKRCSVTYLRSAYCRHSCLWGLARWSCSFFPTRSR